ncbi:MAG: response regulator [Deltaproteobacteria bacterium]|nr:response regulator [Deltaproteobacteria bacterium]MBW2151499.1 response regulator [Deltaproteobacteria bacterium]
MQKRKRSGKTVVNSLENLSMPRTMKKKKKKILVVDNHQVVQKFMTKLLKDHGHEVVAANDGLSALEVLKSFVPDVIFCDLIMPNIGGEKLCKIVRNMPKLKNAFIIIVSAIAAEKKINLKAIGADACIAKGPFNKMPQYILGVLDGIDKKSRNQLARKVVGIEDVHARQITKELLSSRGHLELILNNISEGILELNQKGKIIYTNPSAVSLIGFLEEQILSAEFRELFDGIHLHRVMELLDERCGGLRSIPDHSPVNLNGKQVSLTVYPVKDDNQDSTVVILKDVSEQKQMEAQLQRAQKMKAIGTLAGGVAHDLNNILSGLVSYPELLLMKLPANSPLAKPLQTIQRSGEKAVAIVQDLLTLARREVAVNEVVNLNQIVTEYLTSPEYEKLISHHPKVELKTDLDKSLLNIKGSKIHLSKTVMNLVSNASEAMPEGGRLTIKTRNRYIDKPISGYDKVEEGDYVTLTISDTGLGISSQDMDRVFEPFYTKKVMGRSGTGLGMAVVWGTVKDHNGYIDIKSKVGKGTSFTLYFPVTRQKLPSNKSLLSVDDYMGNGETILVVDDIQEQREIAVEMLNRLDYNATAVSGGDEAIEYIKKHQVDLIVLDMIMEPGMSGLETYREITKMRPHQKAIITSGFAETEDVKKAQKLGAGKYVKKPYTLEKIGLAIKEELEK